ncbi:MAG: tRNA pseudouridine(55) synthase TruB [Bacteroidales bacterium]|nr:tRNA pseudouridine(55) synthase TruB [Bacteroidales bacterium]
MTITNAITQLPANFDFSQGHVLLINKDLRWTSFDVVNKVRYLIKQYAGIKKIKVGHGGTLDPLASGVLVVGIGKETKNLANYQNEAKEYIAEITFGAITASYDLETPPEGNFETAHISAESIQNTLREHFTGTIQQTPPIFSAKSINGQRAYVAARNGEDISMKSQEITIYNAELLDFAEKKAYIRIACSKGTYIRSIAHDLGVQLQSGAYLSALTRTKSGGFSVEECMTIEEFKTIIKSPHPTED